MRWQNLIHKKCPNCDAQLTEEKDRAVMLECKECGFLISQNRLLDILTDETHILRRYLTPHEKTMIEEASGQKKITKEEIPENKYLWSHDIDLEQDAVVEAAIFHWKKTTGAKVDRHTMLKIIIMKYGKELGE